jgi:uroporphyrinogen decarboxylase
MIDDMTPRERRKAIAEGRPADRVISGFHAFGLGPELIGKSQEEIAADTKLQIEADVAIYRRYGVDQLMGFFPIPALFGVEMGVPKKGGHPYVAKTLNLGCEDLKKPIIEDPKTDSRLEKFWQHLEGVLETIGDEVPFGVAMEGPFTLAGRIIGVDTLLRKTLKDPEYVHTVLEKILETQIKLIASLEGYGVEFMIPDPVSSGDLISVQTYRTFAKPYITRLFAAMKRYSPGQDVTFHICGNTSKILQDIAEVGADIFSADNAMDMAQIKHEIGDKIIISGNVKPTETMLLGTPADVDADVKLGFQKSWDSPKGYIPALGCGMPPETPKENIETLFAALRKYGKYPLKPENFA